MRKGLCAALAGLLSCAVWTAGVLAADYPEAVKKPVKKAVALRKATQKKADAWAVEKEKLLLELKALEAENRELLAREDKLSGRRDTLDSSVSALRREEREISRLTEEMPPFLEELSGRLAAMVEEGSPFLAGERKARVEKIRLAVADPEVPVSEKFRKITEALFIEAEYGNTIEVYQEKITVAGEPLMANILRLGRTALFFQSPDGQRAGIYDVAGGTWQLLPQAYNRAVGSAVEIGEKRRTAELLDLPLGRIVR